jgi:hypothetical protein
MYEGRADDKTAEHSVSLRKMQIVHSLVLRPVVCKVVVSGIGSPTFRRNVLSPSLLSKSIAGYFLGIVFDPEIEALHSAETSANLCRTTRHHILEDCTLHVFNYLRIKTEGLAHSTRIMLRPYDLYKKVMGLNLSRTS